MKAEQFEEFIKEVKDRGEILGKEKLGCFAVLVSLVKLNGDYHFLFQKRSEHIRQGSEICFPGGKFDEDLDETFEDTAIRETHEELGLDKDKIKVISKIDTYVSHVYIENYLGILEINSLDDLNINKDEVEKVFTIPVDYFIKNNPETYAIKVKTYSSEIDDNGDLIEYLPVKELDLPKRYHKSWSESFRDVYVYRTEYGTLWGITASIVYNTVNKYLK